MVISFWHALCLYLSTGLNDHKYQREPLKTVYKAVKNFNSIKICDCGYGGF